MNNIPNLAKNNDSEGMNELKHFIFNISNTFNEFFIHNKLIISYIGFGTSIGIYVLFVMLGLIKKLMGNKNKSKSG
ncbi:hypothetical protein EKO25_02240 [Bacillus sp. SAJ1]|nr:hypothetical protein EKO25_02240 [Bacillus sp. SAJ1]